MISVCKKFRFDAAHHLPHYDGICKNVHGHTYFLEITVTSNSLVEDGPKIGMVIDFMDLKAIVKEAILDKLDHTDLNDTFENPTAEIMVKWIFGVLKPLIFKTTVEGSIRLSKVRLWETPDSYAEVTG
jgi:6-pyruvoyltetrahydropterin/6-carboxytetrahydropterin synthase